MSASPHPPNDKDQYVIYMVTYLLDANGVSTRLVDRRGGEHKVEQNEHVYEVKLDPTEISATTYAYQFYRAIPLRGGRGKSRFHHSGHATATDRSQLFSREGKPLGHVLTSPAVEAEKALARDRLTAILAAKKKPSS